ncbi:molybdate ABC transporter substrate-binding protein [Pseudalkalibacillus caeni]|uniref:Molybdate ABC transporter substrate-binding protein n=1 Tax=Exobacillus caeni TaxID=2574798 RepID=A0A5R9F0T7_9BACL|nr:molybdate ABC transporter substrate-binding protein [Pseudalkalibacillus caeni]TLS37242.1 molybdate ABC transporter substrate-binding protein [Pseudalkalibacillus caeni]
MKRISLLLVIIFLLSVTGCADKDGQQSEKQPKEHTDLTVSAAASLQDAMTEIKKDFEQENKNITLSFNFGSSGALQQQISQGAPVDVFFSAAEDKFNKLQNEGLISKKIDLAKNEIVLVVPAENSSINNFQDIVNADKLSIGIPESVPAGKYAKQTLETLNLWNIVEDKMVYAKDVRQVLSYVETGNVEAGIVYRTDAEISSKVKVAATADESSHTPIVYPLGIIKNTKHSGQAQEFFQYMQTKPAIEILKKYGFDTIK